MKLSEVLDYPQNKLHGSIMLHGIKGSSKDNVMGSLDFWFKLHTHDNKKIKKWIEKQEALEKFASSTNKIEKDVLFLEGEKKRFNNILP